MAAVDVGVGQDDHLAVAGLGDVELLAEAGADGRDQGLDLVVLEHPVDAGPLDVEDLAADGQDRLVLGIAGPDGRTAGRVALDDEQLRLADVLGPAVGQLAGQAGALQGRLAPGGIPGLAGRHAGPGRGHRLGHDLAGLARVLLQPFGELLVGRPLDQRAHRDVAQLGLGLALELGIAELDRHDGGEALADVLAEEVVVLLLERALGPGVLVDHGGQGLLEALLVHAALDGGDAVGEAVDALVVAGVPLQGDLDLAVVLGGLEVGHPLEQRLLGGVEVADEVDDAAGVLVDDGGCSWPSR